MRSQMIAASAVVVSAVSVQIGAALGATLFPLLGPAGVVALRQAVSAVVLIGIARPTPRTLVSSAARPALLLGITLIVMNLSLYAAVERIGLGLAVTLEFLGPLTLALLGSRRRSDLACAALAGLGVVLLTGSVWGIDPLGVLLGLTAGAAWAGYIVFSQRAGKSLPGVQGTAIASIVAALVTAPFLVIALLGVSPSELAHVALIGLAVGTLSSALPYSLDLLVLRVIRRQTFGVLQSIHPAAAALAGLFILGQALSLTQIIGLTLVSVSNVIVVLRGTPPPEKAPPPPLAPLGTPGAPA
ncbi:EamA family transporter [Agromyces atrinae]|uniref:EamA family transporter n=1 Tax=Agromyces atrinae TaxID=592376 RepID=UPI001F571E01|nr:EamA family transporter [Agromyces atrinae]MCI2959146.1 EamA family transporter [Agromyces atrinae]